MIALQLLYISLNVSDLEQAQHFYCEALGFTIETPAADAPSQLATLLGAERIRAVKLQRGNQFIELGTFHPPGLPYPTNSQSNDLWFQHCALVTNDICAECKKLDRFEITPISRNGPELLTGGIIAYKFRDRDGHPLEFIQFPEPNPITDGGIDHSAISVADVDRSVAFYKNTLGLNMQAQQQNTGPAQDALDDLDEVQVDVIGLGAKKPAPHLELLAYKSPPSQTIISMQPSDIAATRQVYLVDSLDQLSVSEAFEDGTYASFMRDPDGHGLLLLADKMK